MQMPGPQFPIIDRLLALQAALQATPEAAASSFVERAALLQRIGAIDEAATDAEHAQTLDPADPRAMALFCRLAADLPRRPHHHEIAVALLASPFASSAERRAALPLIDRARLPLLLRHDMPLNLRLTLVHGRSDTISVDGSGAQDQILPLAQDGQRGIFAIDCLIARHAAAPRHLTLRMNQDTRQIEVPSPRAPSAPLELQGPVAQLTIVMPVKDGGAVLADCLRTTLAELSTLEGARLVLVDDGSEQAATHDLMARAALRPDVTLIRSPGGLGFTAAVNLGLRQVGAGPVLLLNSDVWVPRHSFRRLLDHLRAPDVGTVTPLSNNAGSFCLAGPGKPAAMPPPEICERLAAAAVQRNAGCAIDMPSGNGFAMLISERCLRAIGPLSGIYESGYYEEVDFCLRASLRGWRHVAAADCFVGHVGSVTYGATKARLTAGNYRRLLQRFPHYADLYQRFVALDPLAAARERLLACLRPEWHPEPIDEWRPRPAGGRVMLPCATDAPVVLPCAGDTPPRLLQHRFRVLRPMPLTRLHAAGVELYPHHGLWARFDRVTENMLIHDGPDSAPLAAFALRDAESQDLARIEAAVLDLLPMPAPSEVNHALPV